MNLLRKILISCMLLAGVALESNAVVKPTTLYVYGFSASFNDSTVYITDIMTLDSAWVDNKTEFLYGRAQYSYQMKAYLQQQGVAHPTTIISFATTRKAAEKKYMKLRSKYTDKKGSYHIKYLSESEFRFTPVSAADDQTVVTEESKQAKKEEKQARKEAEKIAKENKKKEKQEKK